MGDVSKQIREAARKLLEENEVELVIGFEQGSLPLRATPCFIRRAQDVDRLVWNSFCENNLATYLPKKKGRIGIVAKGCDSRSIVGFLKEKQIERENLVIIGVPCEGMIDRKAVKERLGGREILAVEEDPEGIVVKGDDYEEKMEKRDLLPDSCRTCMHRNPVLYNVLIGEALEEQKVADPFEQIRGFEGKDDRGEVGVFLRTNRKMHSMLRMPKCLPHMLLRGMLCGLFGTPVVREVY